jgi:hypothetical protein
MNMITQVYCGVKQFRLINDPKYHIVIICRINFKTLQFKIIIIINYKICTKYLGV